MEHDLQQQIAEFLAEVDEVAALDRVHHLVSLFERVWRYRAEILLQIQGHPPTGARKAAMISINREMSRDGFIFNAPSGRSTNTAASMPMPEGRPTCPATDAVRTIPAHASSDRIRYIMELLCLVWCVVCLHAVSLEHQAAS